MHGAHRGTVWDPDYRIMRSSGGKKGARPHHLPVIIEQFITWRCALMADWVQRSRRRWMVPKTAIQAPFSLACDLSRSDCLLKGMWLSSVGRHFSSPHTAPADRWSLFPSDPSKEMTLIRPKCSIIYSLLASPCNSLLRLNKGEGG